jgi:hypothetical protein
MLFEDLYAVANCLQFDMDVGRRLVPALVPEDRGDGAVRTIVILDKKYLLNGI